MCRTGQHTDTKGHGARILYCTHTCTTATLIIGSLNKTLPSLHLSAKLKKTESNTTAADSKDAPVPGALNLFAIFSIPVWPCLMSADCGVTNDHYFSI